MTWKPTDRDWFVPTSERAAVEQLEQSRVCAKPLASILVRGYTDPAFVIEFLNPAPGDIHLLCLLPDISLAIDLLERAPGRNEGIEVYADRDIEGTSMARLSLFGALQPNTSSKPWATRTRKQSQQYIRYSGQRVQEEADRVWG